MAGYSGTPLVKKLGIGPGHRVALVGAPRGISQVLGALPEGAHAAEGLDGRSNFNVIVVFAVTAKELGRWLDRARRRLDERGGLWLAWPKRASGVPTELGEALVRSAILESGLVNNKVCAIDETWSGLRAVVRVKDRKGAAKAPGRRAAAIVGGTERR